MASPLRNTGSSSMRLTFTANGQAIIVYNDPLKLLACYVISMLLFARRKHEFTNTVLRVQRGR